jgi:hypothetical protein
MPQRFFRYPHPWPFQVDIGVRWHLHQIKEALLIQGSPQVAIPPVKTPYHMEG